MIPEGTDREAPTLGEMAAVLRRWRDAGVTPGSLDYAMRQAWVDALTVVDLRCPCEFCHGSGVWCKVHQTPDPLNDHCPKIPCPANCAGGTGRRDVRVVDADLLAKVQKCVRLATTRFYTGTGQTFDPTPPEFTDDEREQIERWAS